ncbi:DNA polymerase Y family protein [Cupriavidus sp. WS]|uniref:Y-family DNA polymerase n=1 Tax=Cupriavidus sp. WS TaxID=1312922 RepID=UPI00037799EC|nr:DNA polymerase Y family protein [Cupriavidus sp. WS]
MSYWIAVHLPRLSLDALQPNWPEPDAAAAVPGVLHHGVPVAVMERERVVLANTPAVALGVQAGMRRGGVQALSAQVVQLEREPAAEAQLMTALALALLHFSPHVSLHPEPDAATVMIDAGASVRLFGGHRALCRAVYARVRRLGVFLQLGCAPTAFGAAWLAAQPFRRDRHGRMVRPARRALRPARMARLLDRLPVAMLRNVADEGWLDGIGCRTVGEVRGLPRAGLQRRLGADVLARLDQAYGEVPVRFAWFAAPPEFAQRMELPGRTESVQGVMAGAQRLLLALGGWLAVRQAGVTRLALRLEHERYRLGCETPATPVTVSLAEPSRDPAHLCRLLQERLDKVQFTVPAVGLLLVVEAMQECLPRSEALFPEPGGTPAGLGRLLDTLMARLGRENVLQPLPLADHRPERASRWCPVDEMPARAPAAPAQAWPARPPWLLAQPLPLAVQRHRPCHGGPLVLLSRPERIESGWWDDALATRDYFVAERADGLRCWVYRQRPGREEGGEYRWFLHGLF